MSGQINRNASLGQILHELALNREYNNYVEIGTWNGQGSTKCLMDGLTQRNDASILYSMESNKKFYDMAYQHWTPLMVAHKVPKLKLIYGRIVDTDGVSEIKHIKEYEGYDDRFLKWRENDIQDYDKCENVLYLLPNKIDVLLLDGGEFTSYSEYTLLKDRTSVIVLDDSRVFKNKKVRAELLENTHWELVHDDLQERNGITIFKRRR